MNEVVTVTRKTRRCIEQWIVRGEFPAPVKIGKNSIAFPLDALITWAPVDKKSLQLAAEFERLAYAPPPDLRPEALSEQIAKQIRRECGVKPDMIMYSALREATPDEVNSIRVSQYLQAVAYVIYGLHPALRPWLSELFKRVNIVVPPDDKAYAVAIMIDDSHTRRERRA
jgi:predicted DNA-binding transcriptional regulator AlpA